MDEVHYGATAGEKPNIRFRRSIFAVNDIKAGTALTEENIRVIRPGNGLKPRHWNELLGKKAASNISRGTPLDWKHIK